MCKLRMRNKISYITFHALFFILSSSFSVYRQKAANDRIFVSQRNKPAYFCQKFKTKKNDRNKKIVQNRR